MQNRSLSLVVPVYNSALSLEELTSRIDAALPGGAYTKELILVNDGSRDESWNKIQALAARYPWVRGICLMRNYGQHNALLMGIRASRNAVIVTLDDDLQHPPEEIPKLLAALGEGTDAVYGVPEEVKQTGGKRLASWLVRLLIARMMGGKIAKDASAFRAFRVSLKPVFENYHGDYVFIDALLAWATTRFASVPIAHQPRKYGRTTYTFHKNLVHAVNMITGFSVLPLQIASLLGFIFLLFGAGLFSYVIWNYFATDGSVAGFTFTVAVISLFSGVQLFCLGIIGAYLARIHLRHLGKPTGIIRETADH
jgi:undecaprenyl-phosphate 4-deoxy-4-formamido-L-arabinose transferase